MIRRVLAVAVMALSLSGTASAYYHFIHFSSRTAPFRPVPQKFDLSALPEKTVTFFIADTSGINFASGDSSAALLSELKAAAQIWNGVDSSDLRLQYGGVSSGAASSSPSIDVVFDLPPGVIAMGGPTVPATSNGQFIPILKSVVHLNADFASNQPTWNDQLFTTFVHELGHALGLQHTFTSSVMSTRVTRSTTKSKPLAADDIAGITALYPKAGATANTGSISGRVTMGGNGVNLASVVAIAPNGGAISTLTNPDGTYSIDGLSLQRSYYVYVHPIPPDADIVLPVDATDRTFPASGPFETVFYTPAGGVTNPALATIVPAGAGVPVNFSVRQRSGFGTYSVESFAFPGAFAARPPFVSPGMANPFVVSRGENLTVSSVRATTIGGPDMTARPYSQAPASYVQLDFDLRTLAIPSNGPRHIVFSANNDIYVLPSAFYHVERMPPVITNVNPLNDGSRSVQITGQNLLPDTRILFDGVTAQVRLYEDLGGGQVRVTVAAPSGAPGYRSILTALNADGQSSLSVQGDNPPSYTYPVDAQPVAPNALLVSPSLLSPGTEAMLQIDGLNTQFADAQVSIGFGISDVMVRRIWAVSPTRLIANVVVSPNALPAALNLTVTSGLQVHTAPLSITMSAAARPFWLSTAGLGNAAPGATVTLQTGASPVTLTSANTTVVINDTIRTTAVVNGNQVQFSMPGTVPAGVASVRLESGSDRSLPIAIYVDPGARAQTDSDSKTAPSGEVATGQV